MPKEGKSDLKEVKIFTAKIHCVIKLKVILSGFDATFFQYWDLHWVKLLLCYYSTCPVGTAQLANLSPNMFHFVSPLFPVSLSKVVGRVSTAWKANNLPSFFGRSRLQTRNMAVPTISCNCTSLYRVYMFFLKIKWFTLDNLTMLLACLQPFLKCLTVGFFFVFFYPLFHDLISYFSEQNIIITKRNDGWSRL